MVGVFGSQLGLLNQQTFRLGRCQWNCLLGKARVIMLDQNGINIKLGDKLSLAQGDVGVVVCNIDGREYSKEYPETHWSYLKEGIMVESKQVGLLHLMQMNSECEDVLILKE